MQWGIGSASNSHSKIELSEKYEKLIIFFFIVCPWKTSLSNYACAVAYFLCCSAAFVWARCLHEGNRSSKAVNTSQLHLMKALASLKKQSPLPRDLTIVAFKKKIMQIISAAKLPTPAEGPASMTRKVVLVLESLHFLFPLLQLEGHSWQEAGRAWKKSCTKYSEMQQVFLREVPVTKWTSKKEN